MANAQRLSRGFYRLAVFLAAIPLLVGGAWSFTVALGETNSAKAVGPLTRAACFSSIATAPMAREVGPVGAAEGGADARASGYD